MKRHFGNVYEGALSQDGQFRTDDLKALAIYDNPSTSYWLKEQIRRSWNCDICDALNDVLILKEILDARFAQIARNAACDD